jgi:NAD(P)H dehydrogenase (quinone)
MRVLSIFCPPVEDSYNAVLHRAAKAMLEREGFDPVLSRQERIDYHDPAVNRAAVRSYVERLLAVEALVLCFPVWNFGLPALLKSFFDRVFLPGVSFDLRADGRVEPRLQHIGKIAAIATYGRNVRPPGIWATRPGGSAPAACAI